MRPLGYPYSNGAVLCARHATDTRDPGNETGRAYGIYNWEEAHSDLVCDVEGCGVILEKNCIDGCGTGGYEHYLFYDGFTEAEIVLRYVQKNFDTEAELIPAEDTQYVYAVTFSTFEELSDEFAAKLIQCACPDAYDLNVSEEEEEEDNQTAPMEGGFPEIFNQAARDQAVALAEEELTTQYIERLERIAKAAAAYYANSQSKGYHGEPELASALYEALTTVNFMKEEEEGDTATRLGRLVDEYYRQ
jgi:hypothetical protein